MIRKLIGGLVVLYSLVMLAGWLVSAAGVPDVAVFEMALAGWRLALWLAPELLLVALVLRHWAAMRLVLVAVMVLAIQWGPYFFQSVPEAEGVPVRVTTFNVRTAVETGDLARLVEIVRELQPDILALQEVSVFGAVHLAIALQEELPYMALEPHPTRGSGQGVMSRWPILDEAYWEYDHLLYSNGNQRVVIDIEGQPVVVYNLHPWPPMEWGGPTLVEFIPAQDRSHRDALRDSIERIRAESGPLLVVGDLNMPETFNEYHALADLLTDAYRAAGTSVGFTYPTALPLIRLDYVFYSDAFAAVDAYTGPYQRVSDHLSVTADLVLVR